MGAASPRALTGNRRAVFDFVFLGTAARAANFPYPLSCPAGAQYKGGSATTGA